MKLEICAYNYASCQVAAAAGADRIELCAGAMEGGTTPSLGMVQLVIEQIPIPAFPMVRPRGGNFVYNTEEKAVMLMDIRHFKAAGCKGIATGAALANGKLDIAFMAAIRETAYPMEVTCHKVFDNVPDAFEALDQLIALGYNRVLTSGLQKTATEGAPLLAQLQQTAGNRIIIMPGGSVRAQNIEQLVDTTHAQEYHSSGLIGGTWIADKSEVSEIVYKLRASH